MKSIFVMLAGFGMLCLGIWLGWSEQSFLEASSTTTGWKTSKAVKYIDVSVHGHTTTKTTKYLFDYEYVVNGQTNTGHANTDDPADRFTVYYECANPSNHQIGAPEPWVGWRWAILGSVCILISTRGVWRACRDYRKFSEVIETPDN